jgi:hypothetical protein
MGDASQAPRIGPAQLALAVSFEGPAATLAEAFDKADRVFIVITSPQLAHIEVTENITPGSDIEVDIPVDMEGASQANALVEIQLLQGSDVLFRGVANTVISAGERATVEVSITPVAHDIQLSPSSASLLVGETQLFQATVFFVTGDEISGADVEWSTIGSGITVDSNGLVSAVGAGSWQVQAQSGEALARADVTVTSPVGSISGQVTAESQPLSGVSVSISGPTSGTTSTSAGGDYSFSDLPPGTYDVTVSGVPADYSCSPPTQVVSLSAGQDLKVDFPCDVVRTGQISGTVLQGSSPIPDVPVSLSGPEGTQSTSTDASGMYSFSGLRSGTYEVEITSPSGLNCDNVRTVNLSAGGSATADFTCDAETQVDLELWWQHFSGFSRVCVSVATTPERPGAPVEGMVTGPSGGVIGSGEHSGSLDGSGTTVFSNDIALFGTYQWTVDVDVEGTPVQATGSVEVTSAAGSAPCGDAPTGDISGTVRQGSTPLSGVEVLLSGPGGSQATSTDASGGYSFTGLEPGTYDVEITPPSGVTCSVNFQTVSLSAGESATADFTCDAATQVNLELWWEHFSGFSRVCVRVTTTPQQSGAPVDATVTGPSGGVVGTGQHSGSLDGSGTTVFSNDISLFGNYQWTVDVDVGGSPIQATASVEVTAAAGSAACS